jgi:uncharacterized protein (TIGR02145 family)
MKQKLFFLMLTLFVLSAASVQAQVTIGADAPPHSSAVLDLQSTALGLKLPTIELGDVSVFQLSGTTTNADGIMVYNSSDATIGGSGKGIYVWAGGWVFVGKSAPVAIPVTRIKITSSEDVTYVNSGGNLPLTATVEPDNASNPTLNWTVIYNPSLSAGSATIDQAGVVSGEKPGDVTVRATATDGSGVYRNFSIITVMPTEEVSSITITADKEASSVEVGRGLQLEAVVAPIAADPTVEWSVDAGSTDFASVNADGLVLGIAPGTATIRATAMDGSNTSKSIDIEILDAAPQATVTEHIGDNDYETFNFNGTVWMVQNSGEGTWSYDRYNGDNTKLNHYYTWEQAANGACPSADGWILPTNLQAQKLANYIKSTNATEWEKAWWFGLDAQVGYANIVPTTPTWAQWGTHLYIWTRANYGAFGFTLTGTTTNYPTNFAPPNLRLFSVRCVKI